jgi:hypothetical protein
MRSVNAVAMDFPKRVYAKHMTFISDYPTVEDAQVRHAISPQAKNLHLDNGPRASASSSIAGILLRCREPPLGANSSCTATSLHHYSITSSALARSDSGTLIPNAFAALRLTVSSNLAD